jgi:hypothetical protein
LTAAWRDGRIEAFHGRSDRKEPRPVPPDARTHPSAAIRPGNRIVGASAMVPVRRAGELIQQVLLKEASFAGVRFSRIEALALWPAAVALAGNGNEGKQPARAKPRGISFAALDRPLIEDMHRMLTATPPEAANPWQAALVVSQRATGHGGPISKSKRLLSRYSAAFRTEHD